MKDKEKMGKLDKRVRKEMRNEFLLQRISLEAVTRPKHTKSVVTEDDIFNLKNPLVA